MNMKDADALYENGDYRDALRAYQGCANKIGIPKTLSDYKYNKEHIDFQNKLRHCCEVLYKNKILKRLEWQGPWQSPATTDCVIHRLKNNDWLCDLADIPVVSDFVFAEIAASRTEAEVSKNTIYANIERRFCQNPAHDTSTFFILSHELGDPDMPNIVLKDDFNKLYNKHGIKLINNPLIKEENGNLSFHTKEMHNYFLARNWQEFYDQTHQVIANPLYKDANKLFQSLLTEQLFALPDSFKARQKDLATQVRFFNP